MILKERNQEDDMKIVDLHCDTLHEMLKQKKRGEHYNLYKREGHLDVERMLQSGYMLQCFAAFVDSRQVESPYERGRELARLYKQLCSEYSPYIAPVHHYQDILDNARLGQMSAVLTIEEGGVLEGSLEHLREFYESGVRMITLTWNYPNEIGYPSCMEETPIPDKPLSWKVAGTYPSLTKRGTEIVETMEEKGIIVDVSHLSDAGFWDVAAITRKPFVASHSNARSICAHKRNLSDAQIRTIAERGGVIGLNYCAEFLEKDPKQITLESFMRHIYHILQVGGTEVLALGSDFDGIDTNPVLPDAGALQHLFDYMQQNGISATAIDKIKGENALRVMKEVMR